jgi:hypothetical protein
MPHNDAFSPDWLAALAASSVVAIFVFWLAIV